MHDLDRTVAVAGVDGRQLRMRARERIHAGVHRIPRRKDDTGQLRRIRERARAERRHVPLEADRLEVRRAGKSPGADLRDLRVEDERPNALERLRRAGGMPPRLERRRRERPRLLGAEAHRRAVRRGEPEDIDDRHQYRPAHFFTSTSPLPSLSKHQDQNSSDSHMASHQQPWSTLEYVRNTSEPPNCSASARNLPQNFS